MDTSKLYEQTCLFFIFPNEFFQHTCPNTNDMQVGRVGQGWKQVTLAHSQYKQQRYESTFWIK